MSLANRAGMGNGDAEIYRVRACHKGEGKDGKIRGMEHSEKRERLKRRKDPDN